MSYTFCRPLKQVYPFYTDLIFPAVEYGKPGFVAINYPVMVLEVPESYDYINVRAIVSISGRSLSKKPSDVFTLVQMRLLPPGQLIAPCGISPPGQLIGVLSGQDVQGGFAFDEPYWQAIRFGYAENVPANSNFVVYVGPFSSMNKAPEMLQVFNQFGYNYMDAECKRGTPE